MASKNFAQDRSRRNKVPGKKQKKHIVQFTQQKKKKAPEDPHVLKMGPHWENLLFDARGVHLNPDTIVNGFSVKTTRKSFIFGKGKTNIVVSLRGGKMIVENKQILPSGKTSPIILENIGNIRTGLSSLPPKTGGAHLRIKKSQPVLCEDDSITLPEDVPTKRVKCPSFCTLADIFTKETAISGGVVCEERGVSKAMTTRGRRFLILNIFGSNWTPLGKVIWIDSENPEWFSEEKRDAPVSKGGKLAMRKQLMLAAKKAEVFA